MAVSKLKKKKSPGLLAKHLSDDAVVIWLRNILNAVVELECVEERCGPTLYKDGGKDPLKVDSYRGTISYWLRYQSFFSRTSGVHFLEAGIPHINQSAYRRSVSCVDATQEEYLRGGNRVYTC